MFVPLWAILVVAGLVLGAVLLHFGWREIRRFFSDLGNINLG